MLDNLIKRYPCLSDCKEEIQNAAKMMIDCYTNGGKILTCGNGGSCADADHIVGELMKGFMKKRPLSKEQKDLMHSEYEDVDTALLEKLQCALPALSLCSFTALNTAFINDVDAELIYAQSLLGIGKKDDVLLCMSTSGNAKNVFYAAQTAKSLGIKVLSLTGKDGGSLRDVSDIIIKVPEIETYKVQELHLPVYHYLCAAVEEYFFKL